VALLQRDRTKTSKMMSIRPVQSHRSLLVYLVVSKTQRTLRILLTQLQLAEVLPRLLLTIKVRRKSSELLVKLKAVGQMFPHHPQLRRPVRPVLILV
jgi:hypothetical protein